MIRALTLPRALGRFSGRLRRDRSGLALIEFAFTMPIVFTIGMYGVEVGNLALANMRISQIALTLADNASRVGESSALSLKQLREADLNDILQGARLQSESYEVTKRGRITLSSLQRNADGGQWIMWQRCLGVKPYDTSYGKEGDGAVGKPVITGMGPAGKQVTAPPDSAVIFVEIQYDYKPVIGQWLVGNKRIAYTAAFIVRDKRDLTKIYDTSAATAQTCDKHTA
ncbi:MAG: hypothetical protein ABS87_06565 [Sphingomonas sp. SCN 67-18]|mgnify:CR=1 FL=1|nr:hypothetical protein [Sphingomonas sp. SCN 67-18]ODU21487.1 MAG: hypothetical protein ABS87_06565 [Sphingomonas sp. SCN 67-18]